MESEHRKMWGTIAPWIMDERKWFSGIPKLAECGTPKMVSRKPEKACGPS